MKKYLLLGMAIWAMLMVSCGSGDMKGYKKTPSGLYYRFELQNKDSQQVQEDDGIVGEMIIRLDSNQVFHDSGRLMQATKDGVSGLFYDGFMMMHKGDKVTFAIAADTMTKYMGSEAPGYIPNTGQKMYLEIHLQDIVSREQIEAEKKARAEQMERERRARELQLNGTWIRESRDPYSYEYKMETVTFMGNLYNLKVATSGGYEREGDWHQYDRVGNQIFVNGTLFFTIEPNGDLNCQGDIYKRIR